MDKRKKKTSVNQYTIYLKMLEDDEIFRTGIIPDNYDISYIQKKWKTLSDSLNLCPLGPQLSADEWKKRLMDWKHTTRSKFRKSLIKPLPGKPKIQITQLEKKAISLWGPGPSIMNDHQQTPIKSELQIEPDPQTYEQDDDSMKLQHPENSEFLVKSRSKQQTTTNYQDNQEVFVETDNKRIKIINEVVLPTKDKDPIELYVEEENQKELNDTNNYDNDNTTIDRGHKSNSLTEIENQSISIVDINNIGQQLKRLADIKQEKLRFEISKFKFKNPGFNFEF